MAYFSLFYDSVAVHCIYVPHLYPSICQWTFRLLFKLSQGSVLLTYLQCSVFSGFLVVFFSIWFLNELSLSLHNSSRERLPFILHVPPTAFLPLLTLPFLYKVSSLHLLFPVSSISLTCITLSPKSVLVHLPENPSVML